MNSSSNPTRTAAALFAALACLAMGGCYEMQAMRGQASLLARREPIPKVIADPKTAPQVRTQLETVTEIRNFATRELLLPDNGSYRSYADVHRQYVVWNVFAAPEFSVQPKQWCFLVVGCVAYRGYFSERQARAYAGRLRADGYDVNVDGVAAYSTLGHFDDPVLNTMLGWSDVQLAAIIFHELTHQLLYVANDAAFNEALATLVEEEGVRRWLAAQGREKDAEAFAAQQQRYLRIVELLNGARAELKALYATKLAPEAMRERKGAVFAALRESYRRQKAAWGGYAGYDDWFGADLNNAQLVSVATYEGCVPGFRRELTQADGDLSRFYARVRSLADMPRAQRDALVCAPS